jgi:hypothetical protein
MSKKRHKRNQSGQRRFDHHPLPSSVSQEINDRLTSIYQDEDGEMLDMKHIKIKKRSPLLRFIFALLVIGTLVCVGVWAKFLLFPQGVSQNAGDDQVVLTLSGPTTVVFGATSTYTVNYENHLRTPLTNTIANIRYPAGFVFLTSSIPASSTLRNEFNLGTIPAQEQGSFTVTGLTYGAVDQTKSWTATLNYQPENITSVQQKLVNLETKVTNSPYTLSITGPDKVTVGTETQFSFTLKNNLNSLNQSLEVVPLLPDNFSLTTSTPALGTNQHWSVPASTSTTVVFTLKGKFTGAGNSTSTPIKGQLLYLLTSQNQNFSVAETTLSTEVASSDVALTTSINGSTTSPISTSQGQILNITLNIKNTTKQSLKNITARLVFQGPSVNKKSIFDWNTLADSHNGTVLGEQISDTLRQGTISWNKKQIPELVELKPDQETSIEVQLPLKSAADFDLSGIKDKTMTVVAGITATDNANKEVANAGSPITVVLGGSVSFENRHTVITDGNGKEVHTFNWVLNNTSSGLKNIQISADVFGDVSFADSSAPSAGNATFEPIKKHITWSISTLPAEADVVNWPFTITVNSKNPTQILKILL